MSQKYIAYNSYRVFSTYVTHF